MSELESGEFELCVNLWYVLEGESGLVGMLYARHYVLAGSERDKLNLLHHLARTDFAAAGAYQPTGYVHSSPIGDPIRATTPHAIINSPMHAYAEFFRLLDENPPVYGATENGAMVVREVPLSDSPLYVLTALLDDGSGKLKPIIRESDMPPAKTPERRFRLFGS